MPAAEVFERSEIAYRRVKPDVEEFVIGPRDFEAEVRGVPRNVPHLEPLLEPFLDFVDHLDGQGGLDPLME